MGSPEVMQTVRAIFSFFLLRSRQPARERCAGRPMANFCSVDVVSVNSQHAPQKSVSPLVSLFTPSSFLDRSIERGWYNSFSLVSPLCSYPHTVFRQHFIVPRKLFVLNVLSHKPSITSESFDIFKKFLGIKRSNSEPTIVRVEVQE